MIKGSKYYKITADGDNYKILEYEYIHFNEDTGMVYLRDIQNGDTYLVAFDRFDLAPSRAEAARRYVREAEHDVMEYEMMFIHADIELRKAKAFFNLTGI